MRTAFLLFNLIGSLVFADNVNDFDRQQIIERIKPLGQVNIEEQPTNNAQPASPQPTTEVAAKEEPGQATYDRYCSSCHQNGLAGAPRFRETADWKARIEAKKVEGLTASAIKGINAMPPKGTCAECSEEEIKNAVQYMLPKS